MAISYYSPEEEILTIDETRKILRIGRSQCYKLLQNGRLKAFRIGTTWKIPKSSIDEFIRTETGLQ